jgi:hypothetical protein
MLEKKVKYTYLYGFVEKDGPDKEEIKGKELFPEHLWPSTTIKHIKLWYGSTAGNKDIKSLLGIQIKYLNYITGEKKETNYQGAPIEGMDVEVQELEIKEGDHLSKFHIGFDDYITHLMFKTIKGENVEIGTVNESTEKQSVNEINSDNNIILNIKGYYSKNGIRSIGCNYISFKDFCFIRWIDLLRLRHNLKDEEYKKKFDEKYNQLNDSMKIVYKTCNLADGCFSIILKYV